MTVFFQLQTLVFLQSLASTSILHLYYIYITTSKSKVITLDKIYPEILSCNSLGKYANFHGNWR